MGKGPWDNGGGDTGPLWWSISVGKAVILVFTIQKLFSETIIHN